MFTLARVIGSVPVGALQPDEIQVVGTFTCPGTAGGVSIELRLIAPAGVPTNTFIATTSTGSPGMPPMDSVAVVVPWTGGHCGDNIEFEVRGMCSGQWTAWQRFSGSVGCYCPRIANLQIAYGPCSGTPQTQSVAITATVMLNPSRGTTVISCDFGDGTFGTQSVPNPAAHNIQQTVTFQHDYSPGGSYLVCLRSGECPTICTTVQTNCQECCDEVTVTIKSQTCLPAGGTGSATVQFEAALEPKGCKGPFEWQVTNAVTNAILQPYTAGGALFSYSFNTAGKYKVYVKVKQNTLCDDSALTDKIDVFIMPCGPCTVSVTGPQQTVCTDNVSTPLQVYSATASPGFSGTYSWEVTRLPSTTPFHQSQGGPSFHFAFPGPGTYHVNVSIQTVGCSNLTASSSVTVFVPPCSCPPGQHLDVNGNCVPDTPSGCPPGQHLDSNGNCISDTPPPCPPGQTRNASGTCISTSRIGCDALLWISLIMIAISGALAVIGCIIATDFPQAAAILGIIALGFLILGLLLFLLWWAICRFFTACSVIIAALHFMGILIFIFGLIAAALGFYAKFGQKPDMVLCVGVSLIQSVIWGTLMYILYRIAVAVKCITENSNGPPPPAPPSSSSSGLTSAGGDPRWRANVIESTVSPTGQPAGLGDYVQAATKIMGFQPCAGCDKRRRILNGWLPMRR